MASLPTPPPNIKVVSYADDITILSSGKKPEDMYPTINAYLTELATWLEERNLRLSTEKSTVSLFSTWTKEVGKQLSISVAGNKIPTNPNVKVLGVTMDPLLTFSQHSKTI